MQIKINEYPELKTILWEFHTIHIDYNKDLLEIYERRWGYIIEENLTLKELSLISNLVKDFGNGVFMPHK